MYLVTGGYFGILNRADTEILVHGASVWARAGPLPQGVSGIRAVSVDNSIIATGRGTLQMHLNEWYNFQEATEKLC